MHSWAVACLSEGIALRRAGIRGRILILGYTAPSDAPLLVRWHLTQTLADEAHARALSGAGWPVRVHLALDTGMHRLGVPAQNTKALLEIFRLPNIRVDGIFSHLCVSDEASSSARRYTAEQTALFWSAVERLRSAGVDVGQVHLHASYGVLNQPPEPCSWVRAGIALYGVYSGAFAGKNDVPLRPVLSLRARVASVREIAAGQGAGYGLAFVARRTTRLAVVTIGYADGLPRNLPEKGGRVLICGRFAPMVGRLCTVSYTHLFALIRQAVGKMPNGPIQVPVKGNPQGEYFMRIEQPRGEAIYYVKGNGTKFLDRFRLRTPTTANIPPMLELLKGCQLADVPLLILTIDPCISCTER